MNEKMPIERYQKYQRMMKLVKELQELEEKIAKLRFFILWPSDSENADSDLLVEQLFTMRKLSQILKERILQGVY